MGRKNHRKRLSFFGDRDGSKRNDGTVVSRLHHQHQQQDEEQEVDLDVAEDEPTSALLRADGEETPNNIHNIGSSTVGAFSVVNFDGTAVVIANGTTVARLAGVGDSLRPSDIVEVENRSIRSMIG